MGKRFIIVAAKAGWRGRETKTMLMGVESAVTGQQLERHCIRAMAQEQGSGGDFWEKHSRSSTIRRGDPLLVPNFRQEGRKSLSSEGF